MQPHDEPKAQYISFDLLPAPEYDLLSQGRLDQAFESKDWLIQFQNLTLLRQASKHYPSIFLNELLPRNLKQILGQVDNLRSNNSKEALTLISESFQIHNPAHFNPDTLRPLVSSLFSKSISEKGFLKNQALKGISLLPKKYSPQVLEELCQQTQSHHASISELAIKILKETIQLHSESQLNQPFLKILSNNLNGKRAVVQKTAKEILLKLKEQKGQGEMENIINGFDLLQEESNTLMKELKAQEKQVKPPNLKAFLQAKRKEAQTE